MNAGFAARVIALALSVAAILPTAAQAAPGQPQPSIAVRLTVVLVTPALLAVTVDAECSPWSGGQAIIDVIVDQPAGAATVAFEGEGIASVACDNDTHSVTVNVEGGPFHIGDANAFAQIIAGSSPAAMNDDARKVTIVAP
jgi:hypothetical protein